MARVAIIGAGPAGLMAAEQLAAAVNGLEVAIFDAMPSVVRTTEIFSKPAARYFRDVAGGSGILRAAALNNV